MIENHLMQYTNRHIVFKSHLRETPNKLYVVLSSEGATLMAAKIPVLEILAPQFRVKAVSLDVKRCLFELLDVIIAVVGAIPHFTWDGSAKIKFINERNRNL